METINQVTQNDNDNKKNYTNIGSNVINVKNGKNSSNNYEQRFIHSIKRLVIMDIQTQLTIFEYKNKWDGADSTDGVDALVKTFYQFAHSIDKNSGKLERVRFEKPRATRQHFRETTRQTQTKIVTRSIVKPLEIMEMVVKDYGEIRAILFVDITSWEKDVEAVLRKRTESYLNLLTKQFTDVYEIEMTTEHFRANIKKISDDIAKNKPSGPEKQFKMMQVFENFNVQHLVGEKNINSNKSDDKIVSDTTSDVFVQSDQKAYNGKGASSTNLLEEGGITLNDINVDYNESSDTLVKDESEENT